MIYIHKCLRCAHEWSSKDQNPLRCPGCGTPYWSKERKPLRVRISPRRFANE